MDVGLDLQACTDLVEKVMRVLLRVHFHLRRIALLAMLIHVTTQALPGDGWEMGQESSAHFLVMVFVCSTHSALPTPLRQSPYSIIADADADCRRICSLCTASTVNV